MSMTAAPLEQRIITLNAADSEVGTLQRRASDPYSSVWVGASAGSGKTTVLTSRVLRLLLAGVEPQRILCLTFTRAAAAEMALRITGRLGNWATCDDETLRRDLFTLQGEWPEPQQTAQARRLFARVLACPGGMRIQTIHAFAQEVLKRFPIEAGLPPHFTVLEESNAVALQNQAQNELLQDAAVAPDSVIGQALQHLVRHLGEQRFTGIMQHAARDRDQLAQLMARLDGPEQLLPRLKSLLDFAPDDSADDFLTAACHEENFSGEALRFLARLLIKKGSKSYAEQGRVMADWLAADNATRQQTFATYQRVFLTEKNEPRARFANKELVDQYPELVTTFQREARRLQSVQERLESLAVAEQSAALAVLAHAINQRYAKAKRQEAALDYHDLIQRTCVLLQKPGIAPWILYKLDGGLDHILVDEAQDTSAAQWQIVSALAEEFFAGEGAGSSKQRTLFVVGDEKQSIYRFQGADPDAFQTMRDYFQQRITAAAQTYDEVPLNLSFRSAPAVLRAVDAVFAHDQARRGVARDSVQHYPQRVAAGRVELWPPVPAAKTSREWQLPLDYRHEADAVSQLAATIASQIRRWLDDGKLVRGRALQPGDIMILVRRRGSFMGRLVRELKQRDVPVAGVDRMVLTGQLPVMDVLALLQFSLLPDDDLTLATVLRGPLIGANEDQLMQLAINRPGTLWQSLEQAAASDDFFKTAHNYLCACLKQADRITPFELVAHILLQACPADTVSGRRALWRRLGPDALDPLDELLNAAQDYSTRYSPSLQGFLHWLQATETEIKRELAQAMGQVRISTVHAAKGLEAPVVFLPDTLAVPRKSEMPQWLWDPESGLPFYLPRDVRHQRLQALRQQERARQLEEYRRLFYVALTRAADELYICGWEPARHENAEESWYQLALQALQPASEALDSAAGPETKPLAVLLDQPLPATSDSKTQPEVVVRATAAPPPWLYRPAPQETGTIKIVAPSQLMGPEPALATPMDRRFTRGRILHRLLQSLPDVADRRREAAARRFLANPQFALQGAEQDAMVAEALTLLRHPDYAPLFGPGSRAEVPLAGQVDGQLISGQIDRLLVGDDAVWIVDFKSNRPPPSALDQVPAAYRAQLAAYAAVLRQIYPDRPVRCFLLWTFTLQLMELDLA
jgi:ATP-dependent helicase/nuclease subunit A